MSDQEFELLKISDIKEPKGPQWLVTDLWAVNAVGIIAGEPKSYKTWLGLDLALSVASGTPCLDKFEVPERGPVLIYLAEDTLWSLKQRLTSISQHRGLSLEDLPLYTLTAPRLQLASPGRYRQQEQNDQDRLRAKIQKLKPKLVLLDPLVRISQADENNANEMSELLGYVRGLQREFNTCVALTHHMRKPRSDSGRQGGNDLRGSSNLYSWGDSLIFVNKCGEKRITVKVEHRDNQAPDNFGLVITEPEEGMRLKLVEAPSVRKLKTPLRDRILEYLGSHKEPLNVHDLRERIGVSNDSLRAALKKMLEENLVRKEGAGYLLV